MKDCYLFNYIFAVGEKRIPDATGKYTSIDKFDSMVFKLNNIFASSCDVINRKILEPSFEAIVDAGNFSKFSLILVILFIHKTHDSLNKLSEIMTYTYLTDMKV